MIAAAAASATAPPLSFIGSVRAHWPEYLSEAFGLALFMISACVFTVFLEHPSSPAHVSVDSALLRRVVMGLAMAGTALAVVTSSLGQRSGAHLNPAITLSYFLLGKIGTYDAIWYATAQFIGGALGVQVAALVVGPPIAHSAVRYAATVPGVYGHGAAFLAEAAISFVLMMAVLVSSNSRRYTRLTPYVAAFLVALWITLEAPVSGMSMNPARTVGSAVGAQLWSGWWLYLTAPALGMVSAGLVYRSHRTVFCAKLHHHNNKRCIFRCNYDAL